MKIGIDFDNTLIDYTPVFGGEKETVRTSLIERDGDDLAWQKLQAIAYGERILEARAFSGARECLSRWAAAGHELYIVSHKSERSHIDPSVKLREAALSWLKKNTVAVAPGNIYFDSTREEKIARIRSLSLDLFVDDLREVLEHPQFPPRTVPIWFNKSRPWSSVEAFASVVAQLGAPAAIAIHQTTGSWPKSVQRLARPGNNRIQHVNTDSGKTSTIKYYGPKGAHRCEHEFDGLSLLWNEGVRAIPQPLYQSPAMDFAIYEKVEGKVLTPAEIQDSHLVSAADFAVELHLLHRRVGSREHRPAVDGRRTLADYTLIPERRMAAIHQVLPSLDRPFRNLIEDRIPPVWDAAVKGFRDRCREHKFDSEQPIAANHLTFSPSDFGFHNILARPTGELAFLDFEYSGTDDPAKLVADFFHTVGQDLSWSQKWKFFDRFTERIPESEAFKARWEAIVDLIGVEWILIVLNAVIPEVRARRLYADPTLTEASLLSERLMRAEERIGQIEKNITAGSRLITVPDR